jgi:Protein of unknown function (DUF1207)
MLINNFKTSKMKDSMTNKFSIVHMLFILLLISLSSIFAQEKLIIFPSNLLVQPFTANTLKPKLGFEFKNNKNELSLNIGSSIDLLHYQIDDNAKLSFGADMFTYTLLRSQSDFHFPVDAVDYLFGFNFGYSRDNYGARLRISHISAHFVDGHFNKDAAEWRDGRDPKVYSREFLEIISFYRINEFRVYAGLTYIYSIDPTSIGTDQYQFGFEYFAKDLISSYLTPYIAYDFRLINIYGYTGNNSLEAGLKYGYSEGRGFSVYLRYFAGYNIHGEYFDLKEKFTSFGFNLDL